MEDFEAMPHPDELNEMLLVVDKKENKVKGVKNLTKDGDVNAEEINNKNRGDFMRIERHGDFFSNFFANFMRQLKEPTRFDFFRVTFSEGKANNTDLKTISQARLIHKKIQLNLTGKSSLLNFRHLQTEASTSDIFYFYFAVFGNIFT